MIPTSEVSILTNEQVGYITAAIAAGFASLGYLCRWGINRITKAIDDSTVSRERNTEKLTELSVKVGQVHDAIVQRPVISAK